MDSTFDPDDLISVPVDLEFYLKDRDDPYPVQHDVGILPQYVAEADVSSIMGYVVSHVDDILNSRDTPRYQFKTSLGGAQIIIVSEIQAVSIHAITEESIQRAMENHHAE